MVEYEFPSSLSSNERSYIHKLCKMNDFISITKGKGSKKILMITKIENSKLVLNDPKLSISNETRVKLENAVDLIQISSKERDELLAKIQKPHGNGFYYICSTGA